MHCVGRKTTSDKGGAVRLQFLTAVGSNENELIVHVLREYISEIVPYRLDLRVDRSRGIAIQVYLERQRNDTDMFCMYSVLRTTYTAAA